MEETFSEWESIRAGVPQDAVLALLLYNIYVVDIPRRPEIEISQFADDTAAFTSNININYAVSNLQWCMSMSDLQSWLYKRKTKINIDKSTAVTLTIKRQVPRNRIKLFEQEIPWSAEAKYLGIRLEISLTWKAQLKLWKIKQCNAL
jgi:hypothetical protein